MALSHADDLQKASIQREGACNKIVWKHKGWITETTEISFAKRRLPAAVISKALRCSGFKARGVELFRDGFLKTNISLYSDEGNRNYFHLMQEKLLSGL